eukprot:3714479-Prymnesium_polylepis.1
MRSSARHHGPRWLPSLSAQWKVRPASHGAPRSLSQVAPRAPRRARAAAGAGGRSSSRTSGGWSHTWRRAGPPPRRHTARERGGRGGWRRVSASECVWNERELAIRWVSAAAGQCERGSADGCECAAGCRARLKGREWGCGARASPARPAHPKSRPPSAPRPLPMAAAAAAT